MNPPIAAPIRVETFIDSSDAIAHLHHEQPYQQWISAWLNTLAPKLSPIDAYELGLKLTDDHEIQQLNANYRKKNTPTDVLSFAALETPLPGLEMLHQEQPLYLGDVIISVETAARQASSAGHSLEKEIAWLTAHGLLHLLGWDHPDNHSLEIMLNKQTELLALIKI